MINARVAQVQSTEYCSVDRKETGTELVLRVQREDGLKCIGQWFLTMIHILLVMRADLLRFFSCRTDRRWYCAVKTLGNHNVRIRMHCCVTNALLVKSSKLETMRHEESLRANRRRKT